MSYVITKDTLVTDEVLAQIGRIPTEDLSTQVDPEFFQKLGDKDFMRIAVLLAEKSYDEGGCPIGGVIINNKTKMIIGKGHNTLIQENNSIVHGETAATIDAGRVERLQGKKELTNFAGTTMYTTLTPCRTCCHQLARTRPDRVVIGDVTNAPSSAAKLHSVIGKVDIMEDEMGVKLYEEYVRRYPEKHYSDWMGVRRYEENKHRDPDALKQAAIEETNRLEAAEAGAILAASGSRPFTQRSDALSRTERAS